MLQHKSIGIGVLLCHGDMDAIGSMLCVEGNSGGNLTLVLAIMTTMTTLPYVGINNKSTRMEKDLATNSIFV